MRVSNSLDLDQSGRNVWPDLGPNCLQRLSVDDTSKQTLVRILLLTDIIKQFSQKHLPNY